MANFVFNGTDLSAYIATSRVAGVHDLSAIEATPVPIPGRDVPDMVYQRRSLVSMPLRCAIIDTTHAGLVTKLAALKSILSPRLGFCTLTVVDRSGLRTFARVSRGVSVDIDSIPWDRQGVEVDLVLERYPWWEDATALTVEIANRNMLSFNQATLDDGATTGWAVGTVTSIAADATVKRTDASAGSLRVNADGTGEECMTSTGTSGVAVSASTSYTASAYVYAPAGSEYRMRVHWYSAAGALLTSASGTSTAMDGTWKRLTVSATSHASAARAAVGIERRVGSGALDAWLDDAQLETGGSASAFSLPNTSSKLYLGGDLSTDVTWTATATATLASGLWFEIAGNRFTYSGALASSDVLVVTTDLADCTKNATRDFANVLATSAFPRLDPGLSAVSKSSANFTLQASYRRRFE